MAYSFDLYINKTGLVLNAAKVGKDKSNWCYLGSWQPSQNGTLPHLALDDEGNPVICRTLYGKSREIPELTNRFRYKFPDFSECKTIPV
jgi:hypothetical protein